MDLVIQSYKQISDVHVGYINPPSWNSKHRMSDPVLYRSVVDTCLTTSPMFDEIRYRINCLVLLYIARPSSTAATIVAKLSSARTISEVNVREKQTPTLTA